MAWESVIELADRHPRARHVADAPREPDVVWVVVGEHDPGHLGDGPAEHPERVAECRPALVVGETRVDEEHAGLVVERVCIRVAHRVRAQG